MARHPHIILPIPYAVGGESGPLLHRGVAALQRTKGSGRCARQADRVGVVRHLPAPARGGGESRRERRRGRGASSALIRSQIGT